MHAILDATRSAIAVAERRYGVRRLEVVGSAARGKDFDPERSQVDFLVTFETDSSLASLEQFLGLKDALTDLLGRLVDLIEAGAVTNPYLKRVQGCAGAAICRMIHDRCFGMLPKRPQRSIASSKGSISIGTRSRRSSTRRSSASSRSSAKRSTS